MAVEWLRSCYRSYWRLFADPSVLSPGRYVFCPPGTPHLPFPHRFGSRNWTQGERELPTSVGEVDAGVRPYDLGGLPVPFPAAVPTGPASCFAVGEPVPALNPSVPPLIAGFPAACWRGGGLPVPPPTPVLWLRPDELSAYQPGDLVTEWRDASPYGHDAHQFDAGFAGTLGPDNGGGPCVQFVSNAGMSALVPVRLGSDFAIYLVLQVVRQPAATFTITFLPSGAVALSPLTITRTSIRYKGTLSGTVPATTPVLPTVPVLAVARRVGTTLYLRISGVDYGPFVLPAVDAFGTAQVTPGVAVGGFGGSLLLWEVRAYSASIDDAAAAAVIAELNARHGTV